LLRQPWAGHIRDQRISLAAYACGGNYALFNDTMSGQLQPGQNADFVLLRSDIKNLSDNPEVLSV
jgi:predicted amidohydrolase YtcJ